MNNNNDIIVSAWFESRQSIYRFQSWIWRISGKAHYSINSWLPVCTRYRVRVFMSVFFYNRISFFPSLSLLFLLFNINIYYFSAISSSVKLISIKHMMIIILTRIIICEISILLILSRIKIAQTNTGLSKRDISLCDTYIIIDIYYLVTIIAVHRKADRKLQSMFLNFWSQERV